MLHLGGEVGVEGANSDGKSCLEMIYERSQVVLIGLPLARLRI